jgi:rod shape-determining protein MreB
MAWWQKKIGIDLGTTTVLVYVPGRGIILHEPSVVAVSTVDGGVLAVGKEAKDMLGRTPDTIVARRPLKDGVIADYRTTEAMLRYFINKATGGHFSLIRPEVMVAVPGGITSTERRAVIDATVAAGARAAYIIKEPIVAAIGANIPIGSPSGHMIVDIGGGTSEMAVIALGGIVASASVRIGGVRLDMAIQEHVRRTAGLAIGERTAEQMKIQIGSAMYLQEKLDMEVKGRDVVTGLPKVLRVTSDDVTAAIQPELQGIIQTVKDVLQRTPPELSADVMDKGIVMSGGTSQLRNLHTLIAEATGVPTFVAEDTQLCVVRGTGIALENLDAYKRSIFTK